MDRVWRNFMHSFHPQIIHLLSLSAQNTFDPAKVDSIRFLWVILSPLHKCRHLLVHCEPFCCSIFHRLHDGCLRSVQEWLCGPCLCCTNFTAHALNAKTNKKFTGLVVVGALSVTRLDVSIRLTVIGTECGREASSVAVLETSKWGEFPQRQTPDLWEACVDRVVVNRLGSPAAPSLQSTRPPIMRAGVL